MENIKNEILDIINSIPEDISPLEKVRYVYVKLGKLFYFDYLNEDFKREESLDFNEVHRVETCVQISNILSEILNRIDPNIKCRVIERKIDNKQYEHNHMANIVTVNDEEYLLDLTLDLYFIQFDLRTSEFGFCGFKNMNLDIISLKETDEMDKKLGLYPNGYTDDKIKEIKKELSLIDFSDKTFEEEIDYRINKFKELMNHDHGFSEGNMFIFKKLIDEVFVGFVERNTIRKENKQKSIYIISKKGKHVYYLYDGVGFNKTNTREIKDLLDDGWYNKSGRLYEYVDDANLKRI